MKHKFFKRCLPCRFPLSRVLRAGLVLGAVCCLVLALGSCGGQTETETAPHSDLPVILVGSDNYPPFHYEDANGQPTGIDVDLAREACRRLGYRPEFHQVVWENKDQELAAGNIDCLWGSFTMTGREDLYQWAGPYLYSRQVVVVQADSNINTLADLAGKRVAVQATSKPETVFLERPEPERVPEVGEVYCFSTMEEVYSAIRKDFVDAIAGHEGAMRTFMEDSPGSWRILDQSLMVSGLGVAFPKGTNESLSAQLTAVLQEMQKDGTTKAIVEKYGFDPDQFFLGRGGSS